MQKSLLAGCNVCGRNHTTESCSFLRELKPIEDTKTPSRARLTLPANLEVQNLADNSTTVVARAPFVRSVQFGPFIAGHTQMLHPAVNFPLKVFGKTEETSYYLDTSDEEACNWMCLVAPATHCKEQNLICYQMGQDIYYTVMKDIQPGEQLRVWYAPYYAVKMGAVPFNIDLTADANRDKPTDHVYESKQKLKEKEKKNFHGMLLSREVTQKLAEQLPARQLGARQVPDVWRCKLCCAQETSVVSFAKHLMSHYKRSFGHLERLLECHFCHQKFATEKLLVKHKVVQHRMVLQRPRLLGSMEEDESAGGDTAEEADNDVPEEHNGRVTSIVIANLMGELPSQISQSGSQAVFVTNTGQILTHPLNNCELQEQQHEALNVLLEQLQSTDSYRDSCEVQFRPAAAGCSTSGTLESTDNSKISLTVRNRKNVLKTRAQENVFSDNGLPEKGTDLVLTHTDMTSQFESIEEEEEEEQEEEETGSDGILAGYKPDSVTGLALNPQHSNTDNVINIINTHVTIISDGSMTSSENQSKSAHVDSAMNILATEATVDKPEVRGSIFEQFQTSNVLSEEMLGKTCTENVHKSMGEEYGVKNCASVNPPAGGTDVITTNNEDCVINTGDIGRVAASGELRLSVEQEDVTSAFLELVSEPNFDEADAQNVDKTAGIAKGHDGISLTADFSFDTVSQDTALLTSDNTKIMDVGPPYNCDICSKEFHKADYLYRHLRKHTGEFTCVSCLAVFARKESLMNHSCFADASGTNGDVSSLTCPYCQKKFLVKKLLKRHMAKHTGEWKCNSCQRFYSSKNTLTSHRCSRKPSPIYQCHMCKKEFLRRSYLDKHMRLHLEMRPCTACGKKLQAGEILQNHQLYCIRGKQLETVGETTCPHCNVAFSHLVLYRQHVYQHMCPYVCKRCEERFKTDASRSSHTCSESLVSCEMCMKHFSSLLSLSRHQIIHGVPQFHCYECSRSFHQCESYTSHKCGAKEETRQSQRNRKRGADNRDEENRHMSTECGLKYENGSGDLVLKKKSGKSGGLVCDVCGEVYKTIHILKAHMQLHGERKFACEICNKKFHRKDVLQEHHSVHQEAQIPCPLCNKKLKTKKSLDVHMHRHTGVRRYSCMDCGKKFFQKGNLLKHAVVHNPNAKVILTCDHCNKNFTSRDYLSQHMLEHTQGRIHLCHLCDKGFVKEHMLKGHIRKFHGGHIFVCPYCSMSVRHRNSIRRHLENRHSELHQEWATPGFLDKLEAGGNVTSSNTMINTSLAVPHHQLSSDRSTTVVTSQTSDHISPSSDVSLLQTDNQTEGAEILLTVSGVPLSSTDSEAQQPVDGSAIAGQMELQVQSEIQGDEVTAGNTFIFSDGTVVQQEDGTSGGDILLYVLDPADVTIDPGY